MAQEARYRPSAPSDGCGNITVPLERLDLDAEAKQYARSWRDQEDAQVYRIGCPSYSDRESLVFIVEAARLLCGVDRQGAAILLRMAVENLEARTRPEDPVTSTNLGMRSDDSETSGGDARATDRVRAAIASIDPEDGILDAYDLGFAIGVEHEFGRRDPESETRTPSE
jgi:hypothetical protein